MSNTLQVYSNEDFRVRTTQDADGTVWFVGKDIAEALEYSEESNPARLFGNVPEIWKGVKPFHTPGGEQEMLCLTEQGVYFFLGRSDKKKALPYQVWIAGDVVPSIRKTGSYSVHESNPSLPAGTLEGARLIFEMAGIKDNQLTLAVDKIYRHHMGYSALQAGEIQLLAPTQTQLLTPTEIGRQFNISGRRVNDILAGAGYQHKIADKWEAIGEGETYAVMLDTNKKHSDGTAVRQLKWSAGILPTLERILQEEDRNV